MLAQELDSVKLVDFSGIAYANAALVKNISSRFEKTYLSTLSFYFFET